MRAQTQESHKKEKRNELLEKSIILHHFITTKNLFCNDMWPGRLMALAKL